MLAKKLLPLLVLLCLLLVLSACNTAPWAQTENLDVIHEAYIAPLEHTEMMSHSWTTPEEMDLDSLMVVYMHHAVTNPDLLAQYSDGENYYFPQADVESYIGQYFGLSSKMIREAPEYDQELHCYVVPIEEEEDWGLLTTSATLDVDKLFIRYDVLDSDEEGTRTGTGTVCILIHPDGTHRYLQNEVMPITSV